MLIGERERANLVVQLARFFYISICRSRSRCRSCRMFYVFLNIRRRSTGTMFLFVGVQVAHAMSLLPYVLRISNYIRRRTHHAVIMAQRVLLWATRSCQRSVQAFMQAINAFMQAVNAFMQAVNTFMQYARSCSMSMCPCRLPVLSDLLVWFSTHCTDTNRRETMPKQHYNALHNVFQHLRYTAVLSCWLAYTAVLAQLLHHFLPYISWIAPARQQCVQHSASILLINVHVINERLPQAIHYNGEIFMCITG